MKYRVFLYIVCLLLSGCSADKGEGTIFPESKSLKGNYWGISEAFGRVFDIGSVGGSLVFRNTWEETNLTWVNINNHQDIRHFGLPGGGPKELGNPGPLITDSFHIDVYDGSKMALMRFDMDSVLAGRQDATRMLFQTQQPGIISLKRLSDSYYVAGGVFQEGRLCLLDSMGNVCAHVGQYPESDNKVSDSDIPFHVLGMAYQSLMCVQPHGTRIALATRYGEIVQLYEWNLRERAAEEIACIKGFEPHFSVEDINGTPNFRPGKDTRWGYLSVSATEDCIFALYSGRIQADGNRFWLGNEVHVFDWNGKPLYRLLLDCEGIALVVKEDRLYLLSEDSEGSYDVVEYDLSVK